MIQSLEDLIRFCKIKENIYIYGAGKWASYLYLYLKDNNIQVVGFIVSSKKGNTEDLFSLPIILASDFKRKDNNYYILTAISNLRYQIDVMSTVINYNIHNVYFLKNDIFMQIKNELNRWIFRESKLYRIEKNCPAEKYHVVFSISDDNKWECHWRYNTGIMRNDVHLIDEIFSKKNALEEFQESYGKYYNLGMLKKDVYSVKKSCNVYMVHSHVDHHFDGMPSLPNWIIPIQVGAALTDKRICALTDNTGENISERNSNYSECTALYWIWKNAEIKDYFGICHYRRHFDIPENDIRILTRSDIDVLTTIPTFVPENINNFFMMYIEKIDIKIMLESIKKKCSQYYDTAISFLHSRFYPPCNMMIMKYDIFNSYCEFAFSVTFEIERFYEERGIIHFNRYLGYIMECLFGIFLMKHKDKLKIAYTNMRFYE